VEEAVNNARKHSHATRISITLGLIKRDLALLEIRDNGRGFNVAEVKQTSGRDNSGMGSMFERAELLNGVLHIESSPNKGTRVQVAIPLTVDAVGKIRSGTAK
jgi:signal transduction histidine kinase